MNPWFQCYIILKNMDLSSSFLFDRGDYIMSPWDHNSSRQGSDNMSLRSLMTHSLDIASHISSFLTDQYLNTAGLNTTWKKAWSNKPRTTNIVDKYTSINQFLTHLDIGSVERPSSIHAKRRFSQEACMKASSLGRIDLLRAAYDSGMAKKDQRVFEGAVLGGQMNTLKYLRFIECPWNENISNMAVECGQFEILIWAVENGCPVNHSTQIIASSLGNLSMVKWLHHNGVPISPEVINAAVYSESTDIIDWARSIGLVYTSTFTTAIESGNMGMIRHLHETRHPWNQEDIANYLYYGLICEDMIEWMVSLGYL